MTPYSTEWKQAELFPPKPNAVSGRFVCYDCAEELYPVRIGLWRCAVCGHLGPLDVESKFAALTYEVEDPLLVERIHQMDTKWLVRKATVNLDPLEVP